MLIITKSDIVSLSAGKREHTHTMATTTYRIVRMFFKGGKRAVNGLSGLTLEQAQEHCRNPESSYKTCKLYRNRKRTEQRGIWFDGYERE